MRNLSVGERQGRGDVPAFDATRLHRIPAPAPKEVGHAWMAVILVSLGCFLLYALIVYLDASKGTQ